MSGPKQLLRVCLVIGLTAGALCVKNVDPSRLIADKPKHQPKPWGQSSGSWINKPKAVPPYAVKMEPMVHYSQHDPLYPNNVSLAKIDYEPQASNSADVGILSTEYTGPNLGGYGQPDSGYGVPSPNALYGAPDSGYGAPSYQSDYYNDNKEPEPIIEIIIKESNESLPAPPTPPPQRVTRPAKEPIQVFYVKYKKNPNSYGGKDDIIYERPIPALTPSTEAVSESETTFSTESSPIYNDYVTAPPAPSTTFRTIIKPDSEISHGTGLKVTFGQTETKWGSPLDEAQKRDSVSDVGDNKNKVKKNSDHEYKRSFVQPPSQHADYQRNNFGNFEAPQHLNQPQFNGFNGAKPNVDPPQQQLRKPGQQSQTYFREDNPHQNFHSQIPVLNQPFSPQQNNFENIAEQRSPPEFQENFHNQQFNNPPNYQHFNNQPNVQQFNNQPNHQQFNGQQNHKLFNNQQSHQFNNQPKQPDFHINPPARNPDSFPERPVQTKPNNERPFISKPFENRQPPIQDRPFESRPFESRPFDSRPFENRPILERPFDSRPFENHQIQNRPFENQPFPSPFESRPIHDRPNQNRLPIENHSFQDRPFDSRPNQDTVNYRPNKPPAPHNIPLNPNPSFVPNDRRPTVPPPQLPTNYNTQPISTKHTVDLKFPPQQQQQHHHQNQQQPQFHQQSQFHQQPQFQPSQFQQSQFPQPPQFQQPQLQQQQFQQPYRPSAEARPSANKNPSAFQPQPVKQQQFVAETKPSLISQYQQQQSVSQQQFSPEIKPSLSVQIPTSQSNNFKQLTSQQPGPFLDTFNRYQQTQTEKNFFRPDNSPWQVSSQPAQSSFKPQQSPAYNEFYDASTVKNTFDTSKSISKSTERPTSHATALYKERSTATSTPAPLTSSSTTESAKNNTKASDVKNIAALPDEVPDELREQLLSSGILSNADIQILDYDKVGDVPIESLPPEALENLYGQGSAPVPSVVLPPNKSGVQMKVVKYDPSTEEGRKIESSYVDRPQSETLDPVVLNDSGYNRFLPLNINGTHFPIPDSPLLKNKAITSVVILSPVAYDLSDDQTRPSRNAAVKVKGVHFVVGDVVKNLVKDPSKANFQTWLKKEKNTPSEEQSVVLLVVKPTDGKTNAKEIYMYDVTHNQVNKLSGELSATFVDVAESNSQSHDLDNLSSDEEVDVVVSGNSADGNAAAAAAPTVSGYSKTDDSSGSIVASIANN